MMNLQKEKTQPVINTHSMAEEAATEGFWQHNVFLIL